MEWPGRPINRAYNTFVRDFGKTAKTYSEAAEDLLGHYGYHELPLPIQYHEDPGQQDQVTTWLEYLAYEYALHYRHRLLIKNGRSKHDQEWKKLVHSNVLRPLETEEHIRSHKSAHECDRDKDRTYDRVVSAKSIMEKAPEWHQNSPTSPAGHQSTKQAEEVRLANAKSRLNEAEKLLELVKRRDKLITEFMRAVGDYYSQKRDAVRTGLRAGWIRGQIPLVKAEMNSSKPPTGSESPVEDRGRKRKRRDVSRSRSPRETEGSFAVGSGFFRTGYDSDHEDIFGNKRPLKRIKPDSYTLASPSKEDPGNDADGESTGNLSKASKPETEAGVEVEA